jgi:hypothetical protein
LHASALILALVVLVALSAPARAVLSCNFSVRHFVSPLLVLLRFRTRGRSLHFDSHAHPRVNAALKTVFAFRKAGYVDTAALKDSGPGYGDIREAAGTLGNRVLASVKATDEAAAEVFDFRKGVGLATLVGDVPVPLPDVGQSTKSQFGSGWCSVPHQTNYERRGC